MQQFATRGWYTSTQRRFQSEEHLCKVNESHTENKCPHICRAVRGIKYSNFELQKTLTVMIVLKYLSKKMLDKWNKTDGLMCAKKNYCQLQT